MALEPSTGHSGGVLVTRADLEHKACVPPLSSIELRVTLKGFRAIQDWREASRAKLGEEGPGYRVQ